MASYTIIGGDSKEYGPISEDDIRLWITEGRLNEQSLARGDMDTEWRALGTFPEFKAAFNPSPLAGELYGSGRSTAAATDQDFLKRDYELDIGGCVSRGFELMKNNFVTLCGGFLIAAAITTVAWFIIGDVVTAVLPVNTMVERELFHLVSAALLAPVVGPLMGGFYLLYIRINRGETPPVGDVFAGFGKKFKDLFLGNLVVGFVTGLCLAPWNVINDNNMLPIAEKLRHATTLEDLQALMPQFSAASTAGLPVLLACMIPMTYFFVNWLFTLPLILDKQMAFWPAMKTGWKMVHKHWWQVFGLTIVVDLVSAAGFLACCVGLIVTIPIGMGATMIAYETIFGPRKN